MSTKQTVAVIGLGNIGQVVATNLSKSSRPFIAADRNVEKASAIIAKLGSNGTPTDIPTAVQQAGILVLAIPFGSIVAFFKQYESDLQGKIIVDPSNPIAPDEKGGFAKVIGSDESAGEINTAALPVGAKLAKALGTLSAASLAGAAFKTPQPNVLFYATNDTSINSDVEELINDMGFAPLRVGDISKSIRIEVFGDLNEIGALGKTVSVEEAKEKI